jgi:chromosomal replication initiation ATPase DnaA
VSAVPEASYPGTATPLRGLSSFAESDREIFFGRDRERKELVALVMGDGFRAGLFYGEAGTGKTSLLRAGLQNDLRDHGVFALYCEDNAHPIESFADALSQASGHTPNEGEKLTAFLSRVIGESDRMYVLILDDIDLVMGNDESVAIALAELFTRVVSRSAGRARFLFACSSDRVHRFAALEQRTGSLFPPTSRYELPRLQPADAVVVLQQMMMLVGMEGQDELPASIVEQLSQAG